MSLLSQRPGADEVPDHHRGYLARIPGDDLDGRLDTQLDGTLDLVAELDPDHRYAPGKWSVREVLVHLADTERIFGYRGLRIARDDATPLPGYEQDEYIAPAELQHRTMADIAAELRALRRATALLYRGLTDEALLRTGTASGGRFSARGTAWVIIGHELHHRAILAERYRAGGPGS